MASDEIYDSAIDSLCDLLSRDELPEMRIPAVMSVHDCLSRLHNGCRVRVDGTRGKVSLIET